MRLFALIVVAGAIFGGLLTPRGGGSGSASAGAAREFSRSVDADPREVMDAVRDSLRAEGLDLVSRADDGDRLRQVIPSTVLSREPDFASLARYGDMIVTARVGSSEAEVRTGFALISTAAHYRIVAAPGPDGKGSVVTIEPRVEEGTGRDSRRIARNLRAIIDRQARQALEQLTASVD